MEQSPLTQQARPDVFEPKVVGLYRQVFEGVEDHEKPDGFWRELFLLRPDIPRLRQILNETDADFLLHIQHQPQQLLLQAIAELKADKAPADEHTLDTLTVFFAVVLAKRYTNPSSDIIEVLAGLEKVDAVFTELVAALDHAIKDGRTITIRQKAVRAAIAVVSGAYQTALVSYFIHRDFFPALMKLVDQLDSPLQASEPFLLMGLLANYNKFEVHNQYRVRFSDFVNDDTMKKVVESVAWTCMLSRSRYVAIHDDTPVGWSVAGTLSYVGLGALAGAKPAAPILTEEQQRELFAEQPGPEVASLLTLYDFTLANKLFCQHFVSQPSADKGEAPPFSTFISFTSYLYQHAYRSARASLYAYLTLLILLILVEDPTVAKILCETVAPVRLCRQRPPLLPLPTKVDRSYAAAIVDLLMDGINHNLRKKLDTGFYLQSLTVLSRLLTFLAKSRTKVVCHWSELWRSLLSFVRFMNQYADDMKFLSGTDELVRGLVDVLALALTAGEGFLPDAKDYDDLFYKLVESGDALVKFRDIYFPSVSADAKTPINTLIGVSQHYQELIESQRAKREHLSPREINKIIKQGYETLSFAAKEGAEQQIAGHREADHKVVLKKIARVAVADAAALVSMPEGRR
ncbi:hypothetical protein LTR36_010645 [Oleoguttula mirabilis]|uniref:Armadillo-like helical domain-containing protein n=1 Tax=Oleoguttula mirabilis TaxID=1507867 RepID=A0AAV9JR48_9PEZI|nr:hypothetical protein LTR36_010645 [Oleoguttula mirabilis]